MDQSQMIRLQNYNHLLLYRHQKFPIKIGMENYMIDHYYQYRCCMLEHIDWKN